MTRTTLVLAVVGAFVLGSIATGTMTYAAPGGSGDSLIVAAINALTTAVQGIEPTVNVNSEATKNVVRTTSTINPAITCPDGSQITGVSALIFTVDDFADLPIEKVIGGGGFTLLSLFIYNVDIDENNFEITGMGEVAGNPSTCGFSGTPFTFSITGQCSESTQLDMTTSLGMTISSTGSAACLVVSDPGVGIIAPG